MENVMEMVRILYASKASHLHPELKQDLIDILNTAVDFNSRNEITGVLYYGYGYFVQCLEGEQSKIDTLFINIFLKIPDIKIAKFYIVNRCNSVFLNIGA